MTFGITEASFKEVILSSAIGSAFNREIMAIAYKSAHFPARSRARGVFFYLVGAYKLPQFRTSPRMRRKSYSTEYDASGAMNPLNSPAVYYDTNISFTTYLWK